MHIPDGYIGPYTYGGLWAAMMPVWGAASRILGRTLKTSRVPLLAVGAAFSFVIMMFNVPIPGGTTGHATGAVLVAILLGPWAAVVAVSVALVVQALMFGDGGITAIGANCFNMAFAGVMAGWLTYRLCAGRAAAGSRRRLAAAAAGSYVGINVSALLTSVELGIQPLLHAGADGRPLYCPFPLSVAVTAVMVEHLLLFGAVEAAVTVLVLVYLRRAHPELAGEEA